MASRPFPARHPGRCADCGERFESGDEIRFNDDSYVIGEECCGQDYPDDSEDA